MELTISDLLRAEARTWTTLLCVCRNCQNKTKKSNERSSTNNYLVCINWHLRFRWVEAKGCRRETLHPALQELQHIRKTLDLAKGNSPRLQLGYFCLETSCQGSQKTWHHKRWRSSIMFTSKAAGEGLRYVSLPFTPWLRLPRRLFFKFSKVDWQFQKHRPLQPFHQKPTTRWKGFGLQGQVGVRTMYLLTEASALQHRLPIGVL